MRPTRTRDEIMTHKQALKMRAAIAAILSFSQDNRYQVAIQKRNQWSDKDDWEVHIFVREEKLSGLFECGLLAHAIEQLGTEFLSIDSEYDISTSGEPNLRQSFKIW